MKDEYREKAFRLLKSSAPVEWQSITEKMEDNENFLIRHYLEAIAGKAGQLAGYIDMRHGFGCGDQGHDAGVKQANRNGEMIHCKVFRYNAFHKFTF